MKMTAEILTCLTPLVFLLSCAKDGDRVAIALGEPIPHDDFQYVVTHYDVTSQLDFPENSAKANGNYYLVKFKVVNRAKRVNHSWDNSIAYVVDEKGRTYENNSALQAKLNDVYHFGMRDRYITPYQTSDSTVFVFELPAEVKRPCLLVRGKTLMLDILDGNRFRRTKVKLY